MTRLADAAIYALAAVGAVVIMLTLVDAGVIRPVELAVAGAVVAALAWAIHTAPETPTDSRKDQER